MAENANNLGLQTHSVEALARRVNGRLVMPPGSSEEPSLISGIAALVDAETHHLSHLSSASYASALPTTAAGAVLLREVDLEQCPTAAIVVENPYWAYAHLSALFEVPQQLRLGAAIDPSASLADDVQVGYGAVVGANATLAAGVVIHANAVIGARVCLEEGVTVHPGAVLADGVSVGAGSSIQANAVIGGEGFGYAPDGRGVLERIAQLGSVRLGKNVSIGAGSTIDRGALGDTVIGDGVKIDNQVQIGHNCVIGKHSVICGCCGIVGSTTIGAHCVLGGGVGVGGDGPITLCDGVTVSGMTHVSRSIDVPGVYSGGVLHSETRRWKRNALRFADLDGLAKRLSAVEKRLRKLVD